MKVGIVVDDWGDRSAIEKMVEELHPGSELAVMETTEAEWVLAAAKKRGLQCVLVKIDWMKQDTKRLTVLQVVDEAKLVVVYWNGLSVICTQAIRYAQANALQLIEVRGEKYFKPPQKVGRREGADDGKC